MDGYAKLLGMQELVDDQARLNEEISTISDEMNLLPQIPKSIDRWIDSVPDINPKNNFSLADFKKMFKISKKYNELIDKKDINEKKIKIVVIDNLIDRIKSIIGE